MEDAIKSPQIKKFSDLCELGASVVILLQKTRNN